MGDQAPRSYAEIPSLNFPSPGFPFLKWFHFLLSLPILGPFIDHLRRFFFNVAARQVIQDLIRRQEAINQLLVESVMFLYKQISLYLLKELEDGTFEWINRDPRPRD
jgi:hypothetical protein